MDQTATGHGAKGTRCVRLRPGACLLTPTPVLMPQDIAARYGVLIEDLGIALRGLFIINPEGVIEQITINSLPIGRNVDEALRLARPPQPLQHPILRSVRLGS